MPKEPRTGQPSLQERFRGLPPLPIAPEFTSNGIINMQSLRYLIDNDIVGVPTRHPQAPLWILNYHKHVENLSAKLGREDILTPLTRSCRGLIVNAESGEIVARPFPKMHETRPVADLPEGTFEVTQKLDGYMGTQYWVPGEDLPSMASRRSFDRSDWATGKLREYVDTINSNPDRYPNFSFDRSKTYVWEVLHPTNRTLVKYGPQEDIVLLGMIDTASGQELPIPEQRDVPFPVVKTHAEITTKEELQRRLLALEEGDDIAEGFVVKMTSGDHEGERYKFKTDKYLWLDYIREGVFNPAKFRPHRVWLHFVQKSSKSPQEFNPASLDESSESFRELLEMAHSGTHDHIRGLVAALRQRYERMADADDRSDSTRLWKEIAPPKDLVIHLGRDIPHQRPSSP